MNPTVLDTPETLADFSNKTVATDELASLAKLNFNALSAKYAPTHRLVILMTTLLLMTLILIAHHQPWLALPKEIKVVFEVAQWVIGTIGLLAYLYNYFADPKKQYALREQDISYQSGLIFHKTVCQPILRVQHVELKRGPIERKVGLASLQVFSAGGAMHTFEIPGLDYDNAENIRQYILSHKDLTQHG